MYSNVTQRVDSVLVGSERQRELPLGERVNGTSWRISRRSQSQVDSKPPRIRLSHFPLWLRREYLASVHEMRCSTVRAKTKGFAADQWEQGKPQEGRSGPLFSLSYLRHQIDHRLSRDWLGMLDRACVTERNLLLCLLFKKLIFREPSAWLHAHTHTRALSILSCILIHLKT